MSVIGILRNERAYRLSKFLTKIPTGSVDPELAPFQNHVTPYALAHIKAQLEFSQKVTVLSETEVQISSGLKNASVYCCECSFFMGMAIPCRHIFAIRRFVGEDLFCPEVIHDRWTLDYYRSRRFITQQRSRVSIGIQPVQKSRVMSENEKYKASLPTFEDLQRCLSSCSTDVYNARLGILKDILSYWVQGK